ncbi:MAG: SxtJ family membrane protein [Dongiaceae bacterium]
MAKNIGLHEDLTREDAVKGSSDRSFGLVFAAVSLVVAGLSLWRGGWVWPYGLAAAAAFGGLALAAPRALAPLNKAWLLFGLLLHRIVNPLVMGLMFFLVIAPMGLVMRLGGKDFLRLKFDRKAPTYWIAREPPGPAPETMRNQF